MSEDKNETLRDLEENAKVKAEARDAKNMKKPEMTPEEALERRKERKARLANVLRRGPTNDRLANVIKVCVPDGRRGKFILEQQEAIIRASNKGFTFDYHDKAPKEHLSPDGKVRVGDLVLMTISVEDRELHREIRQDAIRKNIAKGKKVYVEKAQAEAERSGVHPIELEPSN